MSKKKYKNIKTIKKVSESTRPTCWEPLSYRTQYFKIHFWTLCSLLFEHPIVCRILNEVTHPQIKTKLLSLRSPSIVVLVLRPEVSTRGPPIVFFAVREYIISQSNAGRCCIGLGLIKFCVACKAYLPLKCSPRVHISSESPIRTPWTWQINLVLAWINFCSRHSHTKNVGHWKSGHKQPKNYHLATFSWVKF